MAPDLTANQITRLATRLSASVRDRNWPRPCNGHGLVANLLSRRPNWPFIRGILVKLDPRHFILGPNSHSGRESGSKIPFIGTDGMLKISRDIEGLIARADMTVLSVSVYRALGVAILRKVISSPAIVAWQAAWQRFESENIAASRMVSPFNPVVLNEPVTGELAMIYKHPELLDIMEQIYPDLGIFCQRFVIKDKQSRTPVFFHQDYGYDVGWPEKTSLFLPLSAMTPENGGLAFLPGTHQLGYLGDVGEIDVNIIAPNWPVPPTQSRTGRHRPDA